MNGFYYVFAALHDSYVRANSGHKGKGAYPGHPGPLGNVGNVGEGTHINEHEQSGGAGEKEGAGSDESASAATTPMQLDVIGNCALFALSQFYCLFRRLLVKDAILRAPLSVALDTKVRLTLHYFSLSLALSVVTNITHHHHHHHLYRRRLSHTHYA